LALDTLVAIPFAQLRLQNRPWRFAGLRLMNILVNIVFLYFFLELCPYLIERDFTWINNIYNEDFRIGYVFLSNLTQKDMFEHVLYFRYRELFP